LNPDHAPTNANLAVLLENTDSVRASELARVALQTISDVEELLRIAEVHPVDDSPLLDSNALVEEGIPEIEEVPMLESSPVDDADQGFLLDIPPMPSCHSLPPNEVRRVFNLESRNMVNDFRIRVNRPTVVPVGKLILEN